MAFLWMEAQTKNVHQYQEQNAADQKRTEFQNVAKIVEEFNKRIDTTLFRNSIVNVRKQVIQVVVGINITPARTMKKCFN
jgi:hypothetical protein